MVDQLWSTEELQLVDVGGRHTRVERLKRIVNHPVVQRTLRVCWENPDGAYNCGRCRKCLLTMLTLEGLGARALIHTFPPELDLDAVAAIEIDQMDVLTMWEDGLDAVRAGDRRTLPQASRRLQMPARRDVSRRADAADGCQQDPQERAARGADRARSGKGFVSDRMWDGVTCG